VNRFIDIAAIKVAPNRQRREHDITSHQELVDSIRDRGLFHAPVLRLIGDDYYLVAGERRLRAIRDLYDLGENFRYDGEQVISGFVPHVLLGELDDLAAEEAELEENIRRVDLSWQERSAATERLFNLRSRQAEAAGLVRPSTSDIALEVRGSTTGPHHEATRQEILLAKHLSRPEIAKATTAAEAFKILKRIEQQEKHVELARVVGKSLTSHSHTLENRESIGWMKECDSGVFDVILTDPPYGMGADEFGDSGGHAAGAHFYEDSFESWERMINNFAHLSFQVTKPEAHLYCFCDFDNYHHLKDHMEVVGWKVFRTPLIWYKPNGNRAPWPDAGPQRKYECILFAVKGGKKVNHLRGDVLEYTADQNLGHQAQKPVGLYEDLLRRSAAPGDKVLDPFAGTGPILVAAHNLKVYATAIEQDAGAYGIMVERMKGIV
jgi:DNA modification methylase